MAIGDEDLVVTPSCVVAADELNWQFSASGGPGGQHANTANTRVELTFNIETSRSLTAIQRQRLIERLGPVVRIVASEERSQLRNREIALGRLKMTLVASLKIPRRRRPTRPTAGSVERRLQAKQTRSTRKQDRRPPQLDD